VFSATAALLTVLITVFVSDMELSSWNVLLFLLGAFPGQLLGMVAYGYLTRGHAQSQTRYDFLMAVYVGGVIGGLTAWLMRSLLKHQSPSHH
jgi:hypothetical protein